MSKKSTTASSPLKRPSTRSLATSKPQQQQQQQHKDKYTFQSDDEDHQTKPVLVRKGITPTITSAAAAANKRSRARSTKTPKLDGGNSLRASLSSSNIESDSSTEEGSAIKGKPSGEKFQTPKKRGRKTKMFTTNDQDAEVDKSKQQQPHTSETENIVPPQSIKRRNVKKKSLSTDTNPKSDLVDQEDSNTKLATVNEKDLMRFGSPQHQQPSANAQQQQPPQEHSEDEFSDDSVEFVWKGSSKMSIEILKRRIPKDEPKDHYTSTPADPTGQRKRAIIPRLTNFDALSGQPSDPATAANKRTPQDNAEQSVTKKSSSVITLNNVFQNDFVPSYDDAGAKMTTTTTTTTANTTDEKPRPRIYAVKSTTMKARPSQQQPEIKRPKWMNDQQGKSEEEEDEDNLPPAGEEPTDFDYVPKGQYIPKRPNFRARGNFPVRRGTGTRGRPPGSRRQYHDDDDDDDYDQYEDSHSRYAPRKQPNYRPNRSMYDAVDDNGDYDRSRRMSLTQAYRRNNAVRPPISAMSGQRRIAINNGNHPIYKPYKSSSYRPTPATLGLSTTNRRTSSTSRSPVSTISQSHHHLSSTISKHYSDEDYYHHQQQQQQPQHHHQQQQHHHQQQQHHHQQQQHQQQQQIRSTNAGGQTFVAKMNDNQLNDPSNQSQIFFVNVPQQEQKNQQQVLSVLTTDQQQQQQQVLPVTVVQQVKLPMDAPKQKKILPKPSSGSSQLNTSNEHQSAANNKPFSWSRPPGRMHLNNEDPSSNKNMHSSQVNTDLDTMEAAHVLATAADVTMAADARRKAQQHDDDMNMMVDETPSNIGAEETIQCDNDASKLLAQQQYGTITANIIDENGVEHTVYLSTEEAQQLLGTQGAIIVDGDGHPISIQQQAPAPQTFVSPFALDQAQLQALLAQAGIDPNTPLTIEQVDPDQQQQQQQLATLCTSPGGTQYTVLTQAPTQQQFILQTTTAAEMQAPLSLPPVQPQAIAPKEEITSPPTKRRAFAVKSTTTASRTETFDDVNANDRPRRKIFATKSTVAPMEDDMHQDEEGIIGTRAYHRNVARK